MQQSDILLLDLHLPGVRGDEIIQDLRKQYPAMKIIILTGNNTYNAKMLLNIGVQGYLIKNTEEHLLITAIWEVNDGHVFISPELKERLMRMSKQTKNELVTADELTAREIEVLKLVADELTSSK